MPKSQNTNIQIPNNKPPHICLLPCSTCLEKKSMKQFYNTLRNKSTRPIFSIETTYRNYIIIRKKN